MKILPPEKAELENLRSKPQSLEKRRLAGNSGNVGGFLSLRKLQDTQCWMGVIRQIPGHEEMGLNMDQEQQESAQGEMLELTASRNIPGKIFCISTLF